MRVCTRGHCSSPHQATPVSPKRPLPVRKGAAPAVPSLALAAIAAHAKGLVAQPSPRHSSGTGSSKATAAAAAGAAAVGAGRSACYAGEVGGKDRGGASATAAAAVRRPDREPQPAAAAATPTGKAAAAGKATTKALQLAASSSALMGNGAHAGHAAMGHRHASGMAPGWALPAAYASYHGAYPGAMMQMVSGVEGWLRVWASRQNVYDHIKLAA